MKSIYALSLTLLFIFKSYSQNKNGYVQAGPIGYLKNSSSLIGACIGGGSIKGNSGLGIGVEVLSQNDNGIFVPAYIDARFYLKKSNATPFIVFQPGYVIRNRTITENNIQNKNVGGIYVSGGFGFIAKKSKPGIAFQIKYSMISTKTTISQTYPVKKHSESTNSPGFFGLFLGVTF